MQDTSALLALTRHWLCADQLRSSFFEAFRASNPIHLIEAHGDVGLSYYWVSEPGIFSSLWFAALFVVIEGYRELAFTEPDIDRLLQSEHVAVLRLYRNAIFHFQPSAFHPKLLHLHETHEAEQWLDEIHRRLGTFLAKSAFNISCPLDKPDAARLRLALVARLGKDET